MTPRSTGLILGRLYRLRGSASPSGRPMLSTDAQPSMERNATPVSELRAFFTRRFPLHTLGPAIAVTYVVMWRIFDARLGRVTLSVKALPGLATFAVLFVSLRIVDDLYDLDEDASAQGLSDAVVRLRGRWMRMALAVSGLAVILLNREPAPRVVAFAAFLLAWATPFAIHPWVWGERSRAVAAEVSLRNGMMALCYEGTHGLLISYVYRAWCAANGVELDAVTSTATTVCFWCAYEFWKYARYATKPDWKPYGFSARQVQVALACFLLLCATAQVILVTMLPLPLWHLASIALCVGGILFWLLSIEPGRTQCSRVAFASKFLGLGFIAALDTTLLFAVP